MNLIQAKNLKTNFLRQILTGAFLGIISSSLLGLIIALRILNWNPHLWENLSTIGGLIIFLILFYALLGLIAGTLFTLALKLLFSVLKLKGDINGSRFLKYWMVIYGFLSLIFFIFLTYIRTRPTAHVMNFDPPLVVVYCLILWVMLAIIYYLMSKKGWGLFKASLLPLLICLIFGILIDYFFTPKKMSRILGDPEEIAQALVKTDPQVKLFLLGIDGAEWKVIDRLVSAGKMPVFKSLLERGTRARLLTLDTPKSPLIWTSMATGKAPQKHGIEDFCSFQFPLMKSSFIKFPGGIGFYRLVSTLMPGADMPVNSTIRRSEAVWNILSRAQKKVAVVGWWGTWPAENLNGVMISDRFTYTLFNPRSCAKVLKEGQVFPSNQLDQYLQYVRLPQDMSRQELHRFIPPDFDEKYYARVWKIPGHQEWNPLYQLKLAYASSESFFNATLHILKQDQPDFITLYLEGNDMVSHFFWQYMDPSKYPDKITEQDFQNFSEVIPHYYCYWDSLLGEALKALDANTHIIIVSDHGFGPDPQPKTTFRGGEHDYYGILLAVGPYFKVNYQAQDGNVLDLTPTILRLFNLPLAQDMDGAVKEDIFSDQFLQQHPLEEIKSYETGRCSGSVNTASSIDEQIKNQLRSLGYIK